MGIKEKKDKREIVKHIFVLAIYSGHTATACLLKDGEIVDRTVGLITKDNLVSMIKETF